MTRARLRVRRRALVAAAIVAVLAAMLAWLAVRMRHGAERAGSHAVARDTTGAGFARVTVFFPAVSGDSLVAESRSVIAQSDVHARVGGLVAELARGPATPALALIPAGTAVLHAYLDDRGLLTLDLSPEFRDGFHGGSSAEYLAVTSLARTLAANVPEAHRMQLACGGQPLPSLGGHLPLDQPIDLTPAPAPATSP